MCFNMCVWVVYACVCVYDIRTDAENIEAEALADGLVDELIWKAVKAHMARQGQGPHSFVLREKSQRSFSREWRHFLLK